MPSADGFVPHFDSFDEHPPVLSTPLPDEPPDAPPKSKKKKKREKKDVAARQSRADDDNDSSAYPKSITPSPPIDHAVQWHQGVSLPARHVQPALANSPLVDLEDDVTAMEEVHTLPPVKAPTEPSYSPFSSPKPVHSKLAPISSPPSRPASLHGRPQRDRNNSATGYRPPVPPVQQTQRRRESFASTRPSRFVDPPPPHMPQAHFFSLPDLGLNLNQNKDAGGPAGSEGYCCRIDTLADSGDEISAKKARDALLVGSEGGLEVFRILTNKLEVVGRLEGLRGSVIGAKILPQTGKFDDLQVFRPLVAVIVHGLMPSDSQSTVDGQGRGDAGVPTSFFQTTVEVYSLKTQHYIATLYSSTPIGLEPPALGHLPSLPDPVGDLEVDASGSFITVSSGKSGEVFVFTQAAHSGIEETRFRCIGKFWTSVQKSLSGSRPTTATDGANMPEAGDEHQVPLVSLSQRWLAIVPPMLSPSISIQGFPLLSDINPSPPGITTHAAPPQALVTCAVAGTDTEGTWSRLGRQAAQGLVKYSQKGLEMGLQGWKELTQPSPPGARSAHDRSSSKDELFPPTKATSDGQDRLKSEPALVSFVDLDSLLYWEEHKPKYYPPPMATFALVEGCNFLSISASGTRLLTSSRKGEISIIWDLKQVAHGVTRQVNDLDEEASTGPCIMQLQRIVRNSPSTVLECAWSRDDDCVAILTAHGTIHLHEVPKRPPSKKRNRGSSAGASAPVVDKADATVGLSSGMSPPSANQGFLGSIKSGWQSVSTQVNSIRSSSSSASAFGLPTSFAGFREVTAAAGTAGSRAVAKGLSQGYTAAKGGASDYWHADDNKIRHTKAIQEPMSAKSLRWIRRDNTVSIVVACGGTVHVHPVQHVTRRKGDAVITGLKHEKYAHKAFPLPPIATKTETGSVKTDACADQGPHGFWSLRYPSPPTATARTPTTQLNKNLQTQMNDVETNPPYCPFHVDARVNIYAFEEDNSGSQIGPSRGFERFQVRGHGFQDEEPWGFGEPLPSSTKINDGASEELDDADLVDDELDDGAEEEDEEGISSQMESKLTIQPGRGRKEENEIRINTRRRHVKGHRNGGGGGVNGEFDLLDDDAL